MNVKNNVHFIGIRPEINTVERCQELLDFLREKNLMLVHGENHIVIVDRPSGNKIGTASIL